MSAGDEARGLYPKYGVRRLNDPAGKHDGCRFFVLDPQHDPIARAVLAAYMVEARNRGLQELGDDIGAWLKSLPPLEGGTS